MFIPVGAHCMQSYYIYSTHFWKLGIIVKKNKKKDFFSESVRTLPIIKWFLKYNQQQPVYKIKNIFKVILLFPSSTKSDFNHNNLIIIIISNHKIKEWKKHADLTYNNFFRLLLKLMAIYPETTTFFGDTKNYE